MDFKWLALLSFVVHLWPKLNVNLLLVADNVVGLGLATLELGSYLTTRQALVGLFYDIYLVLQRQNFSFSTFSCHHECVQSK